MSGISSTLTSGLRPPTTLNSRILTTGSAVNTEIGTHFADLTAGATSATLATIINETTPGVINYFGAVATSTATTNAKLKITINGVVTLDRSDVSLTTGHILSIVGHFSNDTATGPGASEVSVKFDTLLVEIAGDGSNALSLAHKYYLT